MSQQEYTVVPLYGGAFSISIPSRFDDASTVRDIPNHQEVFVDGDTDQSIIIELNSVTDLPGEDAIRFMWNDLITADRSENPTIHSSGPYSIESIPGIASFTNRVFFADGSHWVGKFNEEQKNHIRSYMLNIRLDSVDTDLLIIFNIPIKLDEQSSSAKKPIMAPDAADTMIQTVVNSFKINDLSIFQ